MESKEDLSVCKIRKTLKLKVRTVNVSSLRLLRNMLPPSYHTQFRARHGKIAKLLDIEVQPEAISALYQFYDPEMRCFLFRDFQMAPTLEEVGSILDLPVKEEKIYSYTVRDLSESALAEYMNLPEDDLRRGFKKQNNIYGLSRDYLEQHIRDLAGRNDWEKFMEALALVIYGLILFPSIDDLISITAVDVFLAYATRGESPVQAVLSNIYCDLHLCHERNKRGILCALPILFLWLDNHITSGAMTRECMIDNYISRGSIIRNRKEWSDFLVGLEAKDVRWYNRIQSLDNMVIHCGEFPNVPLLGTVGCISYNPILLQRQLGYPIRQVPSEASLKSYKSFHFDTPHTDYLARVQEAWRAVHYKVKEPGIRAPIASDGMQKWILARARKVGLPFQIKNPAIILEENEESKVLKERVATLEQKVGEVESELKESLVENGKLKRKQEGMEEELFQVSKRQSFDQQKEDKLRDSLEVANREIARLKRRLTEANAEKKQVRDMLDDSRRNYWDAVQDLNDKEGVIHDLSMKLEEATRDNEKLVDTAAILEDQFQKIVSISNYALDDVPMYLENAERAMPCSKVPNEVVEFMDYCRQLINRLRAQIRRSFRVPE